MSYVEVNAYQILEYNQSNAWLFKILIISISIIF